MTKNVLAGIVPALCALPLFLSCSETSPAGPAERIADTTQQVIITPPLPDPRCYIVGDTAFCLRHVPAATFPTGLLDTGKATVAHEFWMGETELAYDIWYTVRLWAETNGYAFANRGAEGSHGTIGGQPTGASNLPVARINWCDAVVWCNALSEYLDYTPLYLYWDEPVRDATNAAAVLRAVALMDKGFRLPTHHEWELAARYRGNEALEGLIEYPVASGFYWSPGEYASGATAPVSDTGATMEVAWYNRNSTVGGTTTRSQPAGQKPEGGTALGLFDMSGNLYEWIHAEPAEPQALRGGSYYRDADRLRIGDSFPGDPPDPEQTFRNAGMRVVLSLETAVRELTWESDSTFAANTLVQVQYQGRWYDARILEVDKGLYFITYDGYARSWDEWVGPDRIRERQGELSIQDVERFGAVVDYATAASQLELPATVQVTVTAQATFDCDVAWDTSSYDGTTPGEYRLIGRLVNVPDNVTNPQDLGSAMEIRVRDEHGSLSVLRRGDDTGVDGLLFSVEHDNGMHGYYFGTVSDSVLTHIVLNDTRGRYVGMLVFDENRYPLQWVFPSVSIALTLPRGEPFDPRRATHVFVLDDEQGDFTFDIELNMTVDSLLGSMAAWYGAKYDTYARSFREGAAATILEHSVVEAVRAAQTRHETAFAALLSVAGTGIAMLEKLASVAAAAEEDQDQESSPGLSKMQGEVTDQVRTELAKKILSKARTPLSGALLQMGDYLYRIASGYYDGKDIEGPAVSMLRCRGQSSVPNTCLDVYLPNVPGNVSRCTKVCFATMACFTDICHPMLFSVEDAKKLRVVP